MAVLSRPVALTESSAEQLRRLTKSPKFPIASDGTKAPAIVALIDCTCICGSLLPQLHLTYELRLSVREASRRSL